MCNLSGEYDGFEVRSVIIEDDSENAKPEEKKAYYIRRNQVKLARIRDGGIVDLYPEVRQLPEDDFTRFRIILAAATTK